MIEVKRDSRQRLEEVLRKAGEMRRQVEEELSSWASLKGEIGAIEQRALELISKVDGGEDVDDEIAVLEEEIGKKRIERAEDLRKKILYLQSDFENYRRIVQREKQELSSHAKMELISKLLDTLDSLELALKHSNGGVDRQGIEAILEQLKKVLGEEGLREIKAVGEKFDPNLHEIVEISGDGENEVVAEELRKGYMFQDKVLRPSKVKVRREK